MDATLDYSEDVTTAMQDINS